MAILLHSCARAMRSSQITLRGLVKIRSMSNKDNSVMTLTFELNLDTCRVGIVAGEPACQMCTCTSVVSFECYYRET